MNQGNLRKDYARIEQMVNRSGCRTFVAALCSPGFQAVVVYRFGSGINELPKYLAFVMLPLYWLLNLYVRVFWGIEIGRHAKIGGGFYIGHFSGIIISRHLICGENLSVHQGVTIGVAGKSERRGCPVIGDNVYFSPGSKAYGKISIGDDVIIGANAVVYCDTAPNVTVRVLSEFVD